MARTRLGQDREEKVRDIVTVAQRQLSEGGYAALSMAGIARELNVAQNAIYWYFPSRDHLFVATLRAGFEKLHRRKPPGSHDLVDRAVWIVDRLAEFHPMMVTIHERSRSSEVVAEFDRELETMLRGMLFGALSEHLPPEEADLATAAFAATVEGALLRDLTARQRRDVLRYTLSRFLGRS